MMRETFSFHSTQTQTRTAQARVCRLRSEHSLHGGRWSVHALETGLSREPH